MELGNISQDDSCGYKDVEIAKTLREGKGERERFGSFIKERRENKRGREVKEKRGM